MAISVVQRTTALDASGTGSSTAVFGSNNTAGNTIVVAISMNVASATAFGQQQRPPTDSQGNQYYLIANPGFNATPSIGGRWYAAYNIKAGANTITLSDIGNETHTVAYEIAGLASYAAFDQTASQIASTSSPTSGNTSTTSFANEILLGMFSDGDQTVTYTAGTGYSNVQNVTGGAAMAMATEEQIVSATGTYAATATPSSGPNSIQSSIVTLADTPQFTAVATPSVLGTTFNTTSGTHTVTATPAVNDLIVIVRAATGNTTSTAPTDNNSSGTYTLVTSALKNASADLMEVWVRNSLITSATSTIFTEAPGTTTGGGLVVYKVAGMTKTGLAAIKQSATQANQAASTTPAPAFSASVTSPNPIIGAVFNTSNASNSGTNVVQPLGYVQGQLNNYGTPATSLQTVYNNGGSTGTTQTWQAQSPTAFSSVIVELDSSSSSTPVVTHNLAALGVGT